MTTTDEQVRDNAQEGAATLGLVHLKVGDADRAMRFFGSLFGFMGVLLAIELASIIAALQIFYTLMAVALFAPLLVGLYSRRPTARRAMVTIIASVIVTLFTQFMTGGAGIWILPPSLIGIAAGFVIRQPAARRIGAFNRPMKSLISGSALFSSQYRTSTLAPPYFFSGATIARR